MSVIFIFVADWKDLEKETQQRAAHRTVPTVFSGDRSVEEIAHELEERHRNYRLLDEELEQDAPSHISQQSMLPSVRDPKLWMVKCLVSTHRNQQRLLS